MKIQLTGLVALALASIAGNGKAAGVPGQGSWQTTLQARDLDGNAANGAEAFYDTALNITWLRASGVTQTYWANANNWAKQDRFGLSGWRLPTTKVTTQDGSCDWSYGGTSCGHNPLSTVADGSEMAHLFYESLGNKSYYMPGTNTPQAGYGLTNTGDFQDLQNFGYWSGTESASNPNLAWLFFTADGGQNTEGKPYGVYALAVHDGSIGVPIPEPQTYVLMLAGLGLLGAVVRRRSKQQ